MPIPSVGAPATSLPSILVVDADAMTSQCLPVLNEHQFRVNATSHVPVALEFIRRTSPAIVVTELSVEGRSGLEVCAAAKSLAAPSTVLVTTSEPAAVPDALVAGCDGVLLKPFAPNLLIARISRLLRDRSTQLRLNAARSLGKSAHLSERTDLLRSGTNRIWPNTQCPYCSHNGVTSFDFASMRRAWYACLSCRKVWLARRQE